MHKLVTAAVAAMLLAGVALPAQAQSFGIFFGDEPSDFFGDDDDNGIFGSPPERMICLTDRQIRDTVANMGYSNIALNVPIEKNIQVRATRDGTVYLLDFNFCTGEIEGRTRLRSGG